MLYEVKSIPLFTLPPLSLNTTVILVFIPLDINPDLSGPSYVIPEWQRADAAKVGCILFEGRYLAAASAGEAHVFHQLHGDGTCDGSPSVLLASTRSTDQGRFSVVAEGTTQTEKCGMSCHLGSYSELRVRATFHQRKDCQTIFITRLYHAQGWH